MSRQQRSSGDDWKIALEPASRYSKSDAATLCSTAVSDAMRTAARSSSESEKPFTAAPQAASTSLYQYFRADLTSASARASPTCACTFSLNRVPNRSCLLRAICLNSSIARRASPRHTGGDCTMPNSERNGSRVIALSRTARGPSGIREAASHLLRHEHVFHVQVLRPVRSQARDIPRVDDLH